MNQKTQARLPNGWRWVSLEEACDKITDGTHHSPANGPTGAYKYVTAKNIKPWGLDLEDITYVTEDVHREIYSRCDVRKDDILYVKDGATTGRVAVNPLDEEFSLLSSVGVLRPSSIVLPKYLMYALQNPVIKERMLANIAGVAITRLTLKKLKASEVPLAPIDRQERIVAEIEKQFSRLDEAVANLKRVKANLKRYKAAVLKAAVEGRLVETEAELARREGRRYETGEQLLHRILETRRSQWKGKGKYKEPAAPDTTNLPELPEGWVWATFEVVCGAVSDEGKKISRSEYLAEGALPVIDQGEDEIGGYSDDVELAFAGALPVIAFGDHTRRFKLVRMPFVVGADGVKLIGISSAWAPEFLFWQLQTLDFEDRGYSRHFQFVRNKPLRVPPLSEQHRIVAEVDRRLSLLRETEAQVDANLQRAERLRQSILSRAFSGELFPANGRMEAAA